MKKVWIICSECGYAKEIFDNEVMDYDECPLCRGRMAVDLNQGKKIEPEPLGDNFPLIYNDAKKEKSPTDTEKIMINSLAQEIKDFGEERVWNNLNTIPIDKRLDYLEMFFSALNLLKTENY